MHALGRATTSCLTVNNKDLVRGTALVATKEKYERSENDNDERNNTDKYEVHDLCPSFDYMIKMLLPGEIPFQVEKLKVFAGLKVR